MSAPLTDNTQWGLRERAPFFSCLRYGTNAQGYGSLSLLRYAIVTTKRAPSIDGYGFPTTNCEAGLNHRLHFPACWDGVVREYIPLCERTCR